MLRLPQPFANCYILLFSFLSCPPPHRERKVSYRWRNGGRMGGGASLMPCPSTCFLFFVSLSVYLFIYHPDCLQIWRAFFSLCASGCLARQTGDGGSPAALANKPEQFLLSFLFPRSSNNESIVCILIEAHATHSHTGSLSLRAVVQLEPQLDRCEAEAGMRADQGEAKVM